MNVASLQRRWWFPWVIVLPAYAIMSFGFWRVSRVSQIGARHADECRAECQRHLELVKGMLPPTPSPQVISETLEIWPKDNQGVLALWVPGGEPRSAECSCSLKVPAPDAPFTVPVKGAP